MNPLLGSEHDLRKYSTVLEPLLDSGPRSIMEVMLEAVFSKEPIPDYTTRPTALR